MRWLYLYVCRKLRGVVKPSLWLLAINCVLLFGCTGQSTDWTMGHIERSRDRSGESVAENLTHRYNDNRANCGTTTSPAFLCTGVILRITKTSANYDPWEHSDFSRTTDAVSFSYLRADSNFSGTPWRGTNGFIFFPVIGMPADKLKLEVKCYYPLDGATFYRNAPGKFGCRDSIVTYPYPEASRPCREQGVVTAEQWLAHYRTPAGSARPNAYSCSLMVTSDLNAEAVTAFNEGIRLRAQLIPQQAFADHNELRIKAWPESDPKKIPIQAFFYVGAGVENAKIDQKKYFDKTSGLVVPIIRLTLPASYSAKAKFEYFSSDQAVLPEIPDPEREKPSVPKTYDAAGERLRISDIYNDSGLDVVIPHYPGMAGINSLMVRWNGRVRYNSPVIEVGDPPGERIVRITKLEVLDNIGLPVEVNYSVKEVPGGATEESKKLTLFIEPQTLILPEPTISSSTVTVNFGGDAGYQVRVRWTGSVTRETEWQAVNSNVANRFTIAQSWFDENRGRTVLINYSVKSTAGVTPLMFSHVLRLAIP